MISNTKEIVQPVISEFIHYPHSLFVASTQRFKKMLILKC